MKKSELNQLIKEEYQQVLREGLIDNIFTHLKKVVDDGTKQRAAAEVNTKIAKSMKKIADEEENLKKMLSNELSDSELNDLLIRLKS